MTNLITVSFTAARDLDERGEEVIINVLSQLHAGRYVTGACIGGDAFIGRWLAANRPGAEHVVIVPWDKSRVSPWYLTVDPAVALTVIPMPAGTTYAGRNAELVKQGTAVCAFPAYPEDDSRSRRSGTWQTARMARSAGKLARWDCVKPPYQGQIEKWPGEFAAPGR